MLPEVFFLGLGLWAWLILTVEFILLAIFTAAEKTISGIVSILISMVLLQWLGGIQIFHWIYVNPGVFLIYMGMYLVIGMIWSGIKYRLLSGKSKERLLKAKDRFMEECKHAVIVVQGNNEARGGRGYGSDGYTTAVYEHIGKETSSGKTENEVIKTLQQEVDRNIIPDAFLTVWERTYGHDSSLLPPKLSENKATVISWILYWPLSMIGYVLSDILYDVSEWFINQTKGIYKKIALSAYKDIDERLIKRSKQETWN